MTRTRWSAIALAAVGLLTGCAGTGVPDAEELAVARCHDAVLEQINGVTTVETLSAVDETIVVGLATGDDDDDAVTFTCTADPSGMVAVSITVSRPDSDGGSDPTGG